MHVGPAFITHSQTAELMQPGESALDDPARCAQMAAMLSASLADLGTDATLAQDSTIAFAVIAPVGLNKFRLDQRMTASTGNLWHAINERHQLRAVVAVGASQNDVDRCAVAIDEEVVLAARLAPISRVGASFFPPCTARTDELSAITREKSSRLAPRSLPSKRRCSLSHTPACCQSRARRQHVMPEPHPISWGSISQGRPDCRMNMMPVKIRRSSSRLRPTGVLRGGGAGNNGFTISHNASSTSSRAMSLLHRTIRKNDGTANLQIC
jgi:hypothetical protein